MLEAHSLDRDRGLPGDRSEQLAICRSERVGAGQPTEDDRAVVTARRPKERGEHRHEPLVARPLDLGA